MPRFGKVMPGFRSGDAKVCGGFAVPVLRELSPPLRRVRVNASVSSRDGEGNAARSVREVGVALRWVQWVRDVILRIGNGSDG